MTLFCSSVNMLMLAMFYASPMAGSTIIQCSVNHNASKYSDLSVFLLTKILKMRLHHALSTENSVCS